MAIDPNLFQLWLARLANVPKHGGATAVGHQHPRIMDQSFHSKPPILCRS
jgi:hypothetical protein